MLNVFSAMTLAAVAAVGAVAQAPQGLAPKSPAWPVAKDQVEIPCEGEYGMHLQGIATNHTDALFWSFTVTLVKTDLTGRVLATANAIYHLGDLTYHDGKVYVAACTTWDRPGNNSKVYVHSAEDLSLVEMKPVPEATYGAGGIEYHDGRFYLVGGADPKGEENFIYVYDKDFRYVATHTIPSGHTELGVQTISYVEGFFWLGCYGNILLKVDDACRLAGKYAFDCGYGLACWDGSDVLVGKTPCREEGNSKRWRGVVHLAHTDAERGLVFYRESRG
jgi:hypothetical protein